ncbi:hypothetical protein C8R45DRAFT_1024283, partial [Mycena sanguinolenta]
MDLHPDSEPEVIVISTSDAESTPKRARNAKPFIKSFSFLPSLLRRFQTSGTSGTQTQKYGSGGEGLDQGGDGGTGHGPTVYFSQPQVREPSDFQTIRLGDLKLIKEVRLSPQSAIVGHQSQRVGVRRVYHAEIRRDPGTVTVATYRGDGAEDV